MAVDHGVGQRLFYSRKRHTSAAVRKRHRKGNHRRLIGAIRPAGEKVNVIGLISRAEEIGFRGALAATAAKALPAKSLVISLETSRELPGVKMDEGVILRVGDKTSIFDTKAMRFLGELCAELRNRDKRFRFQRGLMSGGTCEATALP